MPINIIAHCAADIGVPSGVVRRIASGAPKMYKKFRIPKRGGRGFRLVAQPAREVKALQRAMVRFLAKHFEIHEAATAYVKGGSVVKNANAHRGARYILKLDFNSFFESITFGAVRAMLARVLGEQATDIELDLMARALTWRNPNGEVSLCIGAPSSPFISNAIMLEFDAAVSRVCAARAAVYTRYSDDLTISAHSREVLLEIEEIVRALVRDSAVPALRLNEDKRVLVGRTSQMRVTGAYLTTQGEVTVGRTRKRGIRAGINKYLSQGLDVNALSKLKGEIAFACDVEPNFSNLLTRWYGDRITLLVPKKKRN